MATTLYDQKTYFGTNSKYYVRLKVDLNSQSVTNNTSSITLTTYVGSTASGYDINSTANKDGWIKLNGSTVASSSTLIIGGDGPYEKQLLTTTQTVTHNADGTKTITVLAWQEIAITFSSGYVSSVYVPSSGSAYSITLPTIPRAATCSFSAPTIETSTTSIPVTINGYSTSFNYTLAMKVGSTTIKTMSGITNSNTSFTYNFTISDVLSSILAAVPANSRTATCTFTVTTYSGSTSIGTNSSSQTLTIGTSFAPSITSTSIADATTTNTTGVNLVGISNPKATVSATVQSGGSATLSTIQITHGGVSTSASWTGNPMTITASNTYSTSGTVPVTITVTDSRGLSTSTTTNVTVYPYSSPAILSGVSATRDSSGTSINVSIPASTLKIRSVVDSSVEKNAFSKVEIFYKQQGGSYTSAYSTTTVTTSSPGDGFLYNSSAITTTISSVLTTQSYYVKVEVTDKAGVKTSTEYFVPERISTPLVLTPTKVYTKGTIIANQGDSGGNILEAYDSGGTKLLEIGSGSSKLKTYGTIETVSSDIQSGGNISASGNVTATRFIGNISGNYIDNGSIGKSKFNFVYASSAPGGTQNVTSSLATWTASSAVYLSLGNLPAGTLLQLMLGLYGNTNVGKAVWYISVFSGGSTVLERFIVMPDTTTSTFVTRTVCTVLASDTTDVRIYLQLVSRDGSTYSISLYTGTSPDAYSRMQAFAWLP